MAHLFTRVPHRTFQRWIPGHARDGGGVGLRALGWRVARDLRAMPRLPAVIPAKRSAEPGPHGGNPIWLGCTNDRSRIAEGASGMTDVSVVQPKLGEVVLGSRPR